MTEYFTEKELMCPCGCERQEVDPESRKRLNIARGNSDVPYILNSAYRCPNHNLFIGSEPTSSHPKGHAFDIKTKTNRDRFKIIKGLLDAGFHRLGIGKTYIHADDDKDKDPEVVWLY